MGAGRGHRRSWGEGHEVSYFTAPRCPDVHLMGWAACMPQAACRAWTWQHDYPVAPCAVSPSFCCKSMRRVQGRNANQMWAFRNAQALASCMKTAHPLPLPFSQVQASIASQPTQPAAPAAAAPAQEPDPAAAAQGPKDPKYSKNEVGGEKEQPHNSGCVGQHLTGKGMG